MKKLLCLLAVMGVMTLGLSAPAAAGQIMIKNATKFPIWEIYMSDSGTKDWEEDILDDEVLMDGATLRLSVRGSVQKFDLKAVNNQGDSMEWYGLPGTAKEITIFGNGTAEYR